MDLGSEETPTPFQKKVVSNSFALMVQKILTLEASFVIL